MGYSQPTLVAFDPEDPDLIVAGGRDSGVFLSTNGGADWILLTDPFNSHTSGTPHLPRPQFAHFEHTSATDVNIYIGTQGRGVWRFKIRLAKDADTATTAVGIGASVAVGLVDDTTTASITGTLIGGSDVTVSAATQHLLDVQSETGAAGGDVAVTPAVAIASRTSRRTALVDDDATPLAQRRVQRERGPDASAGARARATRKARTPRSVSLLDSPSRTTTAARRSSVTSLPAARSRSAPMDRPTARRRQAHRPPVHLASRRAARPVAASTTRSRPSAASPTRRRPRTVARARATLKRHRRRPRRMAVFPSPPPSRSTSRRAARSRPSRTASPSPRAAASRLQRRPTPMRRPRRTVARRSPRMGAATASLSVSPLR